MDYVGKGRMVPKAGFEPAHPQGALDPESSASASFATSAWSLSSTERRNNNYQLLPGWESSRATPPNTLSPVVGEGWGEGESLKIQSGRSG